MGAIIKKLGGTKKVINRTTGKPFPKSIQDHMKAADKRKAGMKKAGYKGPKHELYETKTKGTYRMKENWTYNPYKKAKPHSKTKKILKEAAPVAAAGAAGVAYGGRDRKWGGGILKKIGKALSKKKPTPKPAPKEPKIGSKEWFDKAGPFERNKVIARRESAKRGDVYNKAGTVVGTPSPHRSAETIMKRHPGSYQLKKGKK